MKWKIGAFNRWGFRASTSNTGTGEHMKFGRCRVVWWARVTGDAFLYLGNRWLACVFFHCCHVHAALIGQIAELRPISMAVNYNTELSCTFIRRSGHTDAPALAKSECTVNPAGAPCLQLQPFRRKRKPETQLSNEPLQDVLSSTSLNGPINRRQALKLIDPGPFLPSR